jgi:prepilin-type processing-associated H-X9-DG protein
MDLVAVLGIGLVLGGVSTASMGSAKTGQRAAVCWSNGAELMKAWSAFAVDRDGTLPGSIHGGLSQNPTRLDVQNAAAGTLASFQPWAQGWQDFGLSTHNTNAAYVTSKKYSSLAEYFGEGRNLTKCPNDRALSESQKGAGWSQRVRTYSGNLAIGPGNGGPGDGPWNAFYQKTTRLSQIRSEHFMYIEENPSSMNDSSLFPPAGQPGSLFPVDVPGSFHNGSTMVTFVDGHVDFRHWESAAMRNLPNTTSALADADWPGQSKTDPAMQRDLKFLYDRTPHQGDAP